MFATEFARLCSGKHVSCPLTVHLRILTTVSQRDAEESGLELSLHSRLYSLLLPVTSFTRFPLFSFVRTICICSGRWRNGPAPSATTRRASWFTRRLVPSGLRFCFLSLLSLFLTETCHFSLFHLPWDVKKKLRFGEGAFFCMCVFVLLFLLFFVFSPPDAPSPSRLPHLLAQVGSLSRRCPGGGCL